MTYQVSELELVLLDLFWMGHTFPKVYAALQRVTKHITVLFVRINSLLSVLDLEFLVLLAIFVPCHYNLTIKEYFREAWLLTLKRILNNLICYSISKAQFCVNL